MESDFSGDFLQNRRHAFPAERNVILPMSRAFHYWAQLSNGKLVLWCYLLWYVSTVAHHFDPHPRIWMNSVGISALIGTALILSVGPAVMNDRWQVFRLFAMPFCVSSFSSLIKGQGFWLVVSPEPREVAVSVGLCVLLVVFVLILRRILR
jgi:hypothetical protein